MLTPAKAGAKSEASREKLTSVTRTKKISPRASGAVDLDIGERIRSARFLQGLTQQQLALALGITFQQLQKYESGANRVSASRLIEIARVLDAPVASLLPPPDARHKASASDLATLIALFSALDPKKQRRALALLQSLSDS